MVTYTTVSTVCAAALLGSLVDLNMLDDQVAGVETLGIGVRLGVLEETEEKLGRLDGPASASDTELLACGLYPSASSKHLGKASPRILLPVRRRVTTIANAIALGRTMPLSATGPGCINSYLARSGQCCRSSVS